MRHPCERMIDPASVATARVFVIARFLLQRPLLRRRQPNAGEKVLERRGEALRRRLPAPRALQSGPRPRAFLGGAFNLRGRGHPAGRSRIRKTLEPAP
eukprot:3811027-Alexandrium_andersonii.AAC.1